MLPVTMMPSSRYERQSNEWSKKIKTVKGYAFSQPARIYAQNDSVLWVSDTHSSKRTMVKMLVHKGEIRNRDSIPFFIQNVNDTNGANWVYISDWRHSCHFHSHISTLPIFQCNCQQEPVVHLQYRLRNRGSYSFYLAAHPSQSPFKAPLSPPQSAVNRAGI